MIYKRKNGAPARVRTRDPLITNQVLYQLSYKGMLAAKYQILRGCKAKIRHLGAEIGVICAGQSGLGLLQAMGNPVELREYLQN